MVDVQGAVFLRLDSKMTGPCIRGMPLTLSLIVDNLAEGVSEAELLEAYPRLEPAEIRAAPACAAEMTRERIIPIPGLVVEDGVS